jgi:hypothetical protein
VVLANGADPVVPPGPGLRELEGAWISREATSMKAVPRRLLILGGGPVGVEMAQVVRRLGGEVALADMSEPVLAREPAPLGEALGEILRREGIELVLSANASAARREGEDYILDFDDGPNCAVSGCSSPRAGVRGSAGPRVRGSAGPRVRGSAGPRVRGIGLESVGIEPDARCPGRCAPARGRRAVGDRRRHRPLADRRPIPGRRRRREHPRRATQGQL